eukprot:TRINITY_DN2288_c0_g2_i3.p1 TRINITY_DN2288_c0_g2~~TRINITY_DN2288_c0_g2_i3.p1  ORF type:complete len:375 (+),score=97.41 TRINITY_DN2288_c0_g2_i3:725-1849(+)
MHGFSQVPEPYSLAPTDDRSLKFLSELYDQLLPNFKNTKKFNIGFDETFDVGKGKSKEESEKKGGSQYVYLEFLRKVNQLVKDRGFRSQYWGDIVVEYPGIFKELPEDGTCLIWGYSANHPFDKLTQLFVERGLSFYVCPGTSSWNCVVGRTENCLRNLKNAAENSTKADGFLITDWGDHGHFQCLSASFIGFIVGAGYSWNSTDLELSYEDLANILDIFVFEDSAKIMGKLVSDLGNVAMATGENQFENSTWMGRLLSDGNVETPKIDFLAGKNHVEKVISSLQLAKMKRQDAEVIKAELELSVKMLVFAAELGHARNGGKIDEIDQKTRGKLAEQLKEIIPVYEERWLYRNRIGGLKESVERLQRTLSLLQK